MLWCNTMVIVNRATLRGKLHFAQLQSLLSPESPSPLIQMLPLGVCKPQTLPQGHEVMNGNSTEPVHLPVEADASLRELCNSSYLANPNFLIVFTRLSASSPSLSPAAEMFLAGNHMACWLIYFLVLWCLSRTLLHF